jgi:hypothetical protein
MTATVLKKLKGEKRGDKSYIDTAIVRVPADGEAVIRMGGLAFSLTRGDAEGGLMVAEAPYLAIPQVADGLLDGIITVERSTQPIPLAPGDSMAIGRKRGIEVFNADGLLDPERTGMIQDPALREVTRTDMELSREHAAIIALGQFAAEVQDLGTLNGTVVPVRA